MIFSICHYEETLQRSENLCFIFKLEGMNVYIHMCMQVPFLPYIWIKFFSAWKVFLCKLKLQIIMRISPLEYVLLFVKEQRLTNSWPFLPLPWYYLFRLLPQNWQHVATISWMYVCMASNKLNCRLSVITE